MCQIQQMPFHDCENFFSFQREKVFFSRTAAEREEPTFGIIQK